jgi:two-component system, LytTR family, response regulator
MKNINCIIVDDEINNVEFLSSLLMKHCDGINIVATALNAIEGIDLIEKYKPDLLFLDIQMPEKSGFDLLKSLPQINFEIIFITAFDQYGIQAIKFSALDYLLKPVIIDELKLAVQKAREKIIAKQKNASIENLLDYISSSPKETPKIALPTLSETRYVKIDDIVRCEASDNYTTFYLQNDEKILVCKTLKEYADLLVPYNFIRTHQSHLVNINFIKSLLKEDGGVLLLTNLVKIPISRQNRESVKVKINVI